MNETNFDSWEGYCRTKLANAVYANYLSRRLKDDGILTASVHPGAVSTELLKFPQFLMVRAIKLVMLTFLALGTFGCETD